MIDVVIKNMICNRKFDLTLTVPLIEEIISELPNITSTRHPLGFVHYDLKGFADLPNDGFVRLHVWDTRVASPDLAGNIHDHTWQLTSAVLLGSLRDQTFSPRQNPQGDFSAVNVRYGEENKFDPADRYELVKISDQVFTRGDVYRIDSRIVHESEPMGHSTVTLVAGIPDPAATASGPLILSRSAQVPPGTAKREALSLVEATTVLNEILQSAKLL